MLIDQQPNGTIASGTPVLILGMPATVLLPYIMQLVCLLMLGTFALVRDGVPTGQIIDVLAAVGAGNGLTAGVASFMAHYAAARVGTAQAKASAPAQAPTPGA